MPKIFKNFSLTKAQPFHFPPAEDLLPIDGEEEEQERQTEPPEDGEPEEGEEPAERGGDEPREEGPPEPPPPDPNEPVSYAKVQADKILKEARRQADEILTQARTKAREEAEEIAGQARTEGHQEGYAQGVAQGLEEAGRVREEQAAALEAEVDAFLQKAAAQLDRQMDENMDDLRDLAMAIAEKVVCVSLKSSSEVISRMIQTAIDKRKRREWVHIYIAECDAKRMTQAPVSLTAALSALSDRVRIIPMANDESGTCIIEMPDEIIDASAATQMNNLRNILMDTPSGAMGVQDIIKS